MDGDILLYGCNIADSSGLAFVNQFGSFTGADIAASTNLTGNSKYGGDWVLEFHTGEINTASLKSQSLVGTLAPTSLAENSGANQVVYTAGLSADTTYSLGGVDSAYFSINASTGAVTLITNPDYEAKNSYGFSVIATLGTDSTFTEQFFTLTITDVNEAPVLAGISVNGTEDTSLAFAAIDFTNAYSDPENTALASITIKSLPTSGTLYLSTTAVSVNDVIAVADLVNLNYVPAANVNGTKTFTVTAFDGLLSSNTATVSINLSPVNDAPKDISLSNSSIAENSAVGTVVGTLSTTDPDSGTPSPTHLFLGQATRITVSSPSLVIV